MTYLTEYQQLHDGHLHFERATEGPYDYEADRVVPLLEIHAEHEHSVYLKLDAEDIDWLIDILHAWKEALA
jgi:hypothetical protein